eukprot:2367706-Amphidinium_carterae.1
MESKLPRARCWHISNLAFVPASQHPLFSPEQQAKQQMNSATPTSPANGTSNLQLTTRGTMSCYRVASQLLLRTEGAHYVLVRFPWVGKRVAAADAAGFGPSPLWLSTTITPEHTLRAVMARSCT